MSFTFTAKCAITSFTQVSTVCDELGITIAPTRGTVKFYDGKTVHGYLIRLPGWRYPVVIDENFEIHSDNYEGQWGDPVQLSRFMNRLALEPIRQRAASFNIPCRISEGVDSSWVMELDREVEEEPIYLGINHEEQAVWA